MELFIVGSEHGPRTEALRHYAEEHGCSTHFSEICTQPFPQFNDKTARGIVLFDDGKSGIADWISRVRIGTRYLSIPLVVVRTAGSQETNTRLLAAGAYYIFDPNCSNERILEEIRSRCDVMPVVEEIRNNLLGPFTDCSISTLREMAGTEIVVKSVYQKTGYKMFGDISAVIGLIAQAEGSMVISFPKDTAVAIIKRVLASFDNDPSEDIIRDCIGEIANVIAGQVRGALANSPYAFGISTPTIVSGYHHEIRHKAGMPCLVVAFGSDVGDFAMQVCMAL